MAKNVNRVGKSILFLTGWSVRGMAVVGSGATMGGRPTGGTRVAGPPQVQNGGKCEHCKMYDEWGTESKYNEASALIMRRMITKKKGKLDQVDFINIFF